MIKSSSQTKLHINLKNIKSNKIFNLHEASDGDRKYYAKVFDQKIIGNYNLDETLEYNIELLKNEYTSYPFPDCFNQLIKAFNMQNSIAFITEPYEQNLEQFIRTEGSKNEKEALKIFEQVFKAAYSINLIGYRHCNLRPEHFVRVGDKWKLNSVVLMGKPVDQADVNSEYFYSAQHQPPEAYSESDFSDIRLTERIVWNLGSILIHILTGSHKLRNESVLNKFKNQPFSFSRIGVIDNHLSPELKKIVGLMCHYDQGQRLKFKQLIQMKFFSAEVSSHYMKAKGLNNTKAFVPAELSLSFSINKMNLNRDANVVNLEEAGDNLRRTTELAEQRQKSIIIKAKKKGKLQTDAQFSGILEQLAEEQQENIKNVKKPISVKNLPSFQIEATARLKGIIDLYKNYIDKGELLGIATRKFEPLLEFFPDRQDGQQLLDLTDYAVNFIKSMDLCQLHSSFQGNRCFFKINSDEWELFNSSLEYVSLQKIISQKRRESLAASKKLQEKILNTKNLSFLNSVQVRNFVRKSDPGASSFQQIKVPYRCILKKSYDLIAKYYSTQKRVEWARLGMYITFCLAVDKIYLQSYFRENFKFYFQWSHSEPCDYVSLYQFQRYLDTADPAMLVQNSKFIIEKYYQV